DSCTLLSSIYLPSSSFFFQSCAHHPALPSFPTRRSSDLSMRFRFCRKSDGAWRSSWAARRSVASVGRMVFSGSCTNESARLGMRSEEHTSELQSRSDLVCRLLLEKKKTSVMRIRCDVGRL